MVKSQAAHVHRRQGRLRLGRGVIGAYLIVVILHGLWDSMDIIATLLTSLYFALPMLGNVWFDMPKTSPGGEFLLSLTFYVGGLVILSAIGITLLLRRWRSGQPAAVGCA